MRLRTGAPRVALIVAPHPDDEVIGAYGLMRALRLQGTRLLVLVVTDGAGSHRASARWPRTRLVRRRAAETRWALARLGISVGAVRTLGLPDGGLDTYAALAGRAIAREVARIRDLDLLVGPTPDDDHADHRVVAAALALTPARVRRLAYAVWPHPASRGRGTRVLPVPGGALAKRWALRVYRTQTGLITDDPDGFALTPTQARTFTRGRETFVQAPP